MNAAHADDVGRQRPGRVDRVMCVLKDDGRAYGRGRVVVRSRVHGSQHPLVVPGPEHAVRQQDGVEAPLGERAGHGVTGEYVRDAGGIRDVSGESALDKRRHGRRDCVDQRPVQCPGQRGRAVHAHGLHDDHVEVVSIVPVAAATASQDLQHLRMLVDRVAERPVHARDHVGHRHRPAATETVERNASILYRRVDVFTCRPVTRTSYTDKKPGRRVSAPTRTRLSRTSRTQQSKRLFHCYG